MPQVWLTYDELGELVHCDAAAARAGVVENSWPRRRCSDQLTRVKLPQALAHEYMVTYVAKMKTPEMSTDDMVSGLRRMLSYANSGAIAPTTEDGDSAQISRAS